VSGLAGISPSWPSHPPFPSPIPARKRPGNIRAIPASSIARTAGWRVITLANPHPTGTDPVAASSRVTPDAPPVKNRSSENQSSENPNSSASEAFSAKISGGVRLPKTIPTSPMRVPLVVESDRSPFRPYRA
jgi:hypothetical protein